MPTTSLASLLIVDDEAMLMMALCNTLQDEGYTTKGFTSAKEALTALREQEFDLGLTDLMMPEMNGIELLRAAQELDRNLVGVIMTGHGTIDTAVEAMKVGALDYIVKPFKLSVVLPVLSRALGVRRLRLENLQLRETEEAVRKVNEELDRRVRERTTELEMVNKELEAVNKELEAFSYSVSHDLRAPLRAVSVFSHILLKDHGPQMSEQAQQLLQRVHVNAQRMEQLIEDLLSFSRLGRQPLAQRIINLTSIVEQTLDELQEESEGRQVEVRVGSLPNCVGDPTLLKQVVVNLLSNAFKFTRQRERRYRNRLSRATGGICVLRPRQWGGVRHEIRPETLWRVSTASPGR
jgi:signal transduction histidine kinase